MLVNLNYRTTKNNYILSIINKIIAPFTNSCNGSFDALWQYMKIVKYFPDCIQITLFLLWYNSQDTEHSTGAERYHLAVKASGTVRRSKVLCLHFLRADFMSNESAIYL